MRPEDAEVRRWLVKAQHDRSAVEKVLTPDCRETDVAAFHCQQAVEKTLKAFLISRTVPFEKVHDLRRLLDHCSAVDAAFEGLRDSVEPLTVFAIAFRYPGPADPSVDEVERALQVVEQVWTFVVQRIEREIIP